MRAWLDVTAGVAGDMLMGALVDAGADLAGIQQAIRAVAGDGIVLRAEPVTRAGLAATKVHVNINAAGGGARTWAQLREQVDGAALAESTRSRALATLDALATAYSRGHDLSPSALELHEVAALDVLADIVGDCEALRLLGVTEVTASPLAIGSGRIRTSHGDLSVPVPSVAELIDGWRLFDVTGEAAAPVNAAAHALSGGTRYLPVGGVEAEQGVLTEGPAQVVGGVGELATPTGTALLRTLATQCLDEPPFAVQRTGVGAGGRDRPDRPNVVRVLLQR